MSLDPSLLTLQLLCRDPGTLATLFVVRFYNPLSCLCAVWQAAHWSGDLESWPAAPPPLPPAPPPGLGLNTRPAL